MPRLRNIAVLTVANLRYGRGILRGVNHFAMGRPWNLRVGAPSVSIMRVLETWRPDGVIAHLSSLELAAALRRLAVPVVNVSHMFEDLPYPRVGVDDDAVGSLVAEEFLRRGFAHFGFLGYGGHRYSEARCAGFRAALAAAGAGEPHVLNLRDPVGKTQSWRLSDRRLSRWVRELPKPVGIMTSNELNAATLCRMCVGVGLAVPEEVSIIAGDDDALVTESVSPQVSGVTLPTEAIGHLAGQTLERLLDGRRAPRAPQLLAPEGVRVRQSSDVLAVPDPTVAQALRFLRENFRERIGITDLLRAVPANRRWLERRFQRLLRQSPLEELQRLRVGHAQRLLARTDLGVPAVAERSGFGSARRMLPVFRRLTGASPREYRLRYRSGGQG